MSSQYRLRKGPVLGLLAIVAVVGTALIARSSLRPQVDVYAPVTVPEAYVGTTYAFDGLVCLRATSIGATASSVSTGGGTTRLGLRPEGVPPAIAFPVDGDAVQDLSGTAIAAGDQRCARLLVTPTAQGDLAAERVSVSFRYGPFGLLRSTVRVTPPATLQVTGTGTDPRSTA